MLESTRWIPFTVKAGGTTPISIVISRRAVTTSLMDMQPLVSPGLCRRGAEGWSEAVMVWEFLSVEYDVGFRLLTNGTEAIPASRVASHRQNQQGRFPITWLAPDDIDDAASDAGSVASVNRTVIGDVTFSGASTRGSPHASHVIVGSPSSPATPVSAAEHGERTIRTSPVSFEHQRRSPAPIVQRHETTAEVASDSIQAGLAMLSTRSRALFDDDEPEDLVHIVMQFDNTFSRLRSKEVQIRVGLCTIAEMAAAEEREREEFSKLQRLRATIRASSKGWMRRSSVSHMMGAAAAAPTEEIAESVAEAHTTSTTVCEVNHIATIASA